MRRRRVTLGRAPIGATQAGPATAAAAAAHRCRHCPCCPAARCRRGPRTMAATTATAWSLRTVSVCWALHPVVCVLLRQACMQTVASMRCCTCSEPPCSHLPCSPCTPAGYKRMASMRRAIGVSAVVQLAYICLRTLWHSVPFLTGGKRHITAGVLPAVAGPWPWTSCMLPQQSLAGVNARAGLQVPPPPPASHSTQHAPLQSRA